MKITLSLYLTVLLPFPIYEENVRESTEQILLNAGYNVTVCANSIEALEIYEKSYKSINIIILDIVMPEMNGMDTFLAMKKINSELKVIISSGYSIDGEAQSIIKEGALDFIQKPYRKNELLKMISETLKY